MRATISSADAINSSCGTTFETIFTASAHCALIGSPVSSISSAMPHRKYLRGAQCHRQPNAFHDATRMTETVHADVPLNRLRKPHKNDPGRVGTKATP